VNKQTSIFRLAQVQLEDNEQWSSHKWQDDCEAANTPPPIDLLIEHFGSLGTRESSDHVWRRGESKSEASVFQTRGVGGNDIDAVYHTTKADRIENLCSTEGRKIGCRSTEYQTQGGHTDHDHEALCSSPDVEHLSHWDVQCC